MAKRKVNIGGATYRRADIPEINGFGMFGETVDVHEDDLERFDRLNGEPDPLQEEKALPKPDGNASLADWSAHAEAQGVSVADLSRDEIRELFA